LLFGCNGVCWVRRLTSLRLTAGDVDGRFFAACRRSHYVRWHSWFDRVDFGFASRHGEVTTSRPERLRQPARAGEEFLRLLGHFPLLEVADELCLTVAFCLPHGLQDARLGDPAEIIVDGWCPARHDHVEIKRLGDPIGMSERARAPVPGLYDGVEAKRHAMREQRLTAVAVECGESIP
jgi:hypothetical protein